MLAVISHAQNPVVLVPLSEPRFPPWVPTPETSLPTVPIRSKLSRQRTNATDPDCEFRFIDPLMTSQSKAWIGYVAYLSSVNGQAPIAVP